MENTYDTIIIGTGPAGYTAAIYTTRYNMSTLVLGEEFGGQMNIDYEVENYPGFKKIKGRELMQKIHDHAETLGAEIEADIANKITKENNLFKIETMMHKTYKSKTIILTPGTKRRKLNIPGEKEFAARGVSYCATCDSAFYKDKTVAVIGGGDSAFASATILLQHVKKLYIIDVMDHFIAKPSMIDQIKDNPKVKFIQSTTLKEIKGDKVVNKILTTNPEIPELEVDGVFVDIGVIPVTNFLKDFTDLDEQSFIKVTSAQETNVKGVFAAGDCTTESNKVMQMVIAEGEAAIAAHSAFDFIQKNG